MAIGKIDFDKGEIMIYRDIKEASLLSSMSYHTLRRRCKEELMFFSQEDGCMYLGNVSIVPSRRGGERDNNSNK